MSERMKISASALKDLKTCPRMAISKRLGFRSPMGPAAQLGTDTHKLFETFVTDGTLPEDASSKAARLFYEGLPYAPKPGEATAERHFVRDWDHEITFHGYIDFDAHGLVGDYKTSSKPQPPDLLTDEQGVLYGWANNEEHGTDRTAGRWIYMNTRSISAFPHEQILTAEHCEKQIEKDLAPRARMLLDLNEQLAPLKLAPEADRVAALNVIQNQPDVFGMTCKWCAFEPHCKKYNLPEKKTVMSEKPAMSIQERLAAMKKKGAPAEETVKVLKEKAAASPTVPPEAQAALDSSVGELAGQPEPEAEEKPKKGKSKKSATVVNNVTVNAVGEETFGTCLDRALDAAIAQGLSVTITVNA